MDFRLSRAARTLALVSLFAFATRVSAQPATAPATSPAPRPNVILILADDMGFSDVGCYGGEIHTPNIDRLAGEGVRFTQFYNMARCCPTRAALLTGLYPHQAGIGAMNQDLGKPAYRGELNDRCVTIAEVLRDARLPHRHGRQVAPVPPDHLRAAGRPPSGCSTSRPTAPISPSKANWPCNRGFEEHWGTIPGVENYYDPYGLVHNEQTIRPEGKDFYYTDFITDHSVEMIDRFARDGKPFFLYVAYTAPHWPMQAREADIAQLRRHLRRRLGQDPREPASRGRWRWGSGRQDWGLSPRAD